MNCQQVHEKVLKIINHKGNVNQTTMRFHLTPVRMAIIKKIRDNKCWQRCEEKGILVHCGCNFNCYNHYGKQYGVSSENQELSYDPTIPLLGIYLREMKTLC